METQQLLDSLTAGTKSLIEQHKQLLQKVKSLELQASVQQREIEQWSVDKESLSRENRELKEQIKTIKLAQSITAGSGDQSSRQIKTKINEYIREIDKCLSLLNRE